MNQRGQTAYDSLFGIVLLLVAIITVLFPQAFGPLVNPVSADQEKMGSSTPSTAQPAPNVASPGRQR